MKPGDLICICIGIWSNWVCKTITNKEKIRYSLQTVNVFEKEEKNLTFKPQLK